MVRISVRDLIRSDSRSGYFLTRGSEFGPDIFNVENQNRVKNLCCLAQSWLPKCWIMDDRTMKPSEIPTKIQTGRTYDDFWSGPDFQLFACTGPTKNRPVRNRNTNHVPNHFRVWTNFKFRQKSVQQTGPKIQTVFGTTYRSKSELPIWQSTKSIIHFLKISYLKTGLKPNKRISVTLSAKDTLNNDFQVTDDFKTDASGKLKLDDATFNSFFARARNNSNNAFLLPEFDKYFINLKSSGNTWHFM